MLVEIEAIHKASRETYGAPRIHAEVKVQGMHHSKKRVARLMREDGIRAKQKKKFKATTDSGEAQFYRPGQIRNWLNSKSSTIIAAHTDRLMEKRLTKYFAKS